MTWYQEWFLSAVLGLSLIMLAVRKLATKALQNDEVKALAGQYSKQAAASLMARWFGS